MKRHNHPTRFFAALATVALISACGANGADVNEGLDTATAEADVGDGEISTGLTWEQFLASAWHDEETGVYYANGDEPFESEKLLREYYDHHVLAGQLAVATRNGVEQKWADSQKRNLTYCVSTTFGNRYQTVVDAMNAATKAWEDVADVNFVYVPNQDGSCNTSNTNVLFDVRPVNAGGQFLAAAFFPGSSRRASSVVIDGSSFTLQGNPTFVGVLRHELGHTLGFRHEHTRPGGATSCFEDNNWKPLTNYDPSSVMHYPQCGGTTRTLAISALDIQGVQSLYGAPGTGTPTQPTQPTQPTTPTNSDVQRFTGSLASNGVFSPPAFAVTAGRTFIAQVRGSGDVDLYVRFNSAPTSTRYACRPFLNGSSETCTLTVPAGATTAHVLLHGYVAGSYELAVAPAR